MSGSEGGDKGTRKDVGLEERRQRKETRREEMTHNEDFRKGDEGDSRSHHMRGSGRRHGGGVEMIHPNRTDKWLPALALLSALH